MLMKIHVSCLVGAVLCVSGCPNKSDSGSPKDTETPSQTQTADSTDTFTDSTDTSSESETTSTQEDTGPVPPWYPCRDPSVHAGSLAVAALSQVDHYFNPEDKRVVDAAVSFPSASSSRITLRVELDCPADGVCDRWDRAAQLLVVERAGQEDEKALEIARYMTPYGVGMCFELDVTAYASALRGSKTVRSFIDTWVGPNEKEHGHGWRVSATFYFAQGEPKEPLPTAVIDLWGYREVEVGNPAAPMSSALGPVELTVPSEVSRAELRLLSTGHGQGNADNCAEFCSLRRLIDIGSERLSIKRWRYDCAKNPIGPTQLGTWSLTRNGWCPGAVVEPSIIDVTELLPASATVTIRYDAETPDDGPYENTCRPQEDEDAICEGCVFHPGEAGNCVYNGGDHTPPVDRISAHLFLYQ
jgi:hypothetical protein